jgi:mannosylglycoprotein endo-beta-mannosidase
MGFSDTLCNWIKKILKDGTIFVKINNVMDPYFKSSKGVRQGDLLSPFLFNAAVICLAKMVLEAQANNLLVGLIPDLIDKGVAIMQYAADTVLCISHDPEKAINLKLLLYMFELMSGLKINYQKSEIFMVGGDNTTIEYYSSLFGCQVGSLPMKYLGVPVTYRTLRNSNLDPLDSKFIKKLDAWIGGSNSSGGHLTLVNSSLSSLPSYFISLFYLNKSFLEKVDKHRRCFFWHGKKS